MSSLSLSSSPSLAGKVIAITGAASGIGFETAREAASREAILALSDINKEALSQAIETLKKEIQQGVEVKASNITITGTVVDVASSSEVDAWIDDVVRQFGRLDGAANVAGVEPRGSGPKGGIFCDVVDISNEDWARVLGINLTGLFYCLRAELRAMKKAEGEGEREVEGGEKKRRGGGSIVNVASIAGLQGRAGLGSYATSKHGVVGLTKTAAKEVGKFGIRVNAMCPGPVLTPMLSRLIKDGETNAAGATTTGSYKVLPLGRSGEIYEIAKAICFLLSDESSFMTGVAMPVDGGAMC